MKRLTLLELVDYVNSGTGKFNEAVFEDITQMLVANLFRTLPPSSHENSANVDNFDPEEEEPSMEPAWPHLQIVSRVRVFARACRWPSNNSSERSLVHGSFFPCVGAYTRNEGCDELVPWLLEGHCGQSGEASLSR